MIPYIGDLSINDALVLKELAQKANSILEFGVGASTQVLRHYSSGSMVSVETMQEWINRTKVNFERIGVVGEVDFKAYDADIQGRYDLIFVDGHKRLRKEFALRTWRYLRYGGAMVFHDTRREFYIEYVAEVIKEFFTQIDFIGTNYNESNMTVVRKRKELKYENWNETENRHKWQYGRGEFNQEEFELYKIAMKDI